jgi:hypothetical protein
VWGWCCCRYFSSLNDQLARLEEGPGVGQRFREGLDAYVSVFFRGLVAGITMYRQVRWHESTGEAVTYACERGPGRAEGKPPTARRWWWRWGGGGRIMG